MPRNSQLAFRRFSRHFVILPVFTSWWKCTGDRNHIWSTYPTDTKTASLNKMAARFNNKYGFSMFSWLWFFLGRLFLFCKQLIDQVSFSLSWIRYLCVQFTSTLTLQQFVYSRTATIPRHILRLSLQQSLYFVPTDSPYIDCYLNLYTTATSPQRQRPLKRVPNRENNFLTTASFFQRLMEKSRLVMKFAPYGALMIKITAITFWFCFIYILLQPGGGGGGRCGTPL